jgi:hypothetical protein
MLENAMAVLRQDGERPGPVLVVGLLQFMKFCAVLVFLGLRKISSVSTPPGPPQAAG